MDIGAYDYGLKYGKETPLCVQGIPLEMGGEKWNVMADIKPRSLKICCEFLFNIGYQTSLDRRMPIKIQPF